MPSLKIKGGNPAAGAGAHSCRFTCLFVFIFTRESLVLSVVYVIVIFRTNIERKKFIFLKNQEKPLSADYHLGIS